MNWDEFQAAKQLLLGSEPAPLLSQVDVRNDNGFVNSGAPKLTNDHDTVFQGNNRDSAFVWLGNGKVRIGGIRYSGLGHPGLAGGDSIYCAGIIKRNYFFFHSGHYHPQVINAQHFFCEFVELTCRPLPGGARDKTVDELCEMALELYQPGTTDKTYTTTFKAWVEERAQSSSVGIPIRGPSGGGLPSMSTGQLGTKPSRPSVRPERSVPPPGYVGGPREPLPVYPPHAWQPDTSTNHCKLCARPFTFSRRRHHCRKCGDIFCEDCTTKRKVVSHPVQRPNSTSPETGPLRVCDACMYIL